MNPAGVSSQIGLKTAADSADKIKDKKLRKACAGFEALLLRQLLATMRESVPKSGLLGNSYADKMFQSMQDVQLAQVLSQGQGMGFGKELYRQLSREMPGHSMSHSTGPSK